MTGTAAHTPELHPLLAQRWSPRAFDPRHALDAPELTALVEAVRWAPSAGNSQPWRLGVALRGTPEHTALHDALAPGNAVWAGAASALVLLAAVEVDDDGNARPWAAYDTGQAAAHLSLQAEAAGLVVHQMGGFDPDAAGRVFDLPPGTRVLVVLAVGRRDDNAVLPEPLAARETAPRTRLPRRDLLLTPTADALALSA